MKKVLYPLTVACFAMLVLVATIHAMGNLPVRQADCAAKNVVKKTDGTCECKKYFLWEDSKSQCVRASLWCSRNYAKRSIYNSKEDQCQCRSGQELNGKGNACMKIVNAIEVTLDDSDPQNGSAQFDFETGKKTVFGSPDLFIGGIVYERTWMAALDWQVVEMGKPLKEITECPAEGYASVVNVNEQGFGSPIYADAGKVFCLKTHEGNYAKLEILSAEYDTEKERRILRFKYVFQPNGTRKF